MNKILCAALLAAVFAGRGFAQAAGPQAGDLMVLVPGGRFIMGSNLITDDEKPEHQVTVSPFYLSKYEVTVAEFGEYIRDYALISEVEVLGVGQVLEGGEWKDDGEASWSNPRFKQGDSNPVVLVTWSDAARYCNYRSLTEGLEEVYIYRKGKLLAADFSRNGYRLPTEAEWEWAASGGPASLKSRFRFIGGNAADSSNWIAPKAGGVTHPVGAKPPNQLGFYDMGGNAAEWCDDWYGPYTADPAVDPHGLAAAESKALRGSSFASSGSSGVMPAFRDKASPYGAWNDTGFRMARGSGPGTALALPVTPSTTTTTTVASPPHQVGSAGLQSPAPQGDVIDVIQVEAGSFMMGSGPGSVPGTPDADELPVHEVSLSGFYIGKYEITQEQYQRVMGANPSKLRYVHDAAKRPVEQVSWLDAVTFCNRLSQIEGLQKVYTVDGAKVMADFRKDGYRLPTEAEWEYAARGGRLSGKFMFSGSNDLGLVAWYRVNSGGETHAVGTKLPNELGICDMMGNVWEWCWDWYGSYNAGPQADPRGPSLTEGKRVLRGGSWNGSASYTYVTRRNANTADLRIEDTGFRVARNWSGGAAKPNVPVAATTTTAPAATTTTSSTTTTTTTTTSTVPPWVFGHMDMIPVEGGTYDGVKLKSFLVGKYEVMVEQFREFVKTTNYKTTAEGAGGGWIRGEDKKWTQKPGAFWDNPGFRQNHDDPVVDMSWYDAVEFCNWLSTYQGFSPVYSKKDGVYAADLSKNGYRLPSENEWEFAAKGGLLSNGFAYSGGSSAGDVAIYGQKYSYTVGAMKPNELGIYDMSGNAWEWCGNAFPVSGDPARLKAALRGGCWLGTESECKVESRTQDYLEGTDYTFGFRVVRNR